MQRLFDSNIVISLRDGDAAVLDRFARLESVALMSIVSRVELENGVMRDATKSRERRESLQTLLEDFDVLGFADDEANIYRNIVAATGFNRSRTLDRMIAATAIRVGAVLVTANVRDFRDVPGLEIEDWSN